MVILSQSCTAPYATTVLNRIWLFLDMWVAILRGMRGVCLGPDPGAYSVRPTGWRVWPLASPPGLDTGQPPDKTRMKTPGRQRCLLEPLHHWLPCTHVVWLRSLNQCWAEGAGTLFVYVFVPARCPHIDFCPPTKRSRRGAARLLLNTIGCASEQATIWLQTSISGAVSGYVDFSFLWSVLFAVTMGTVNVFGLHGRAQGSFLRNIDASVSVITYCVN